MLAAAKAVRQHAGLMVDAMIQDFERATDPWHAQWFALPESFGVYRFLSMAIATCNTDTSESNPHPAGIALSPPSAA